MCHMAIQNLFAAENLNASNVLVITFQMRVSEKLDPAQSNVLHMMVLQTIKKSTYEQFFKKRAGRFIVGGDFNAKHDKHRDGGILFRP